MIKSLSPLKTLNIYLKRQDIITENFVFRIHCILTTAFLLMCSIILTSTQVIGKPIECFGSDEKIVKPVATFCWTTTTFSMPDDFYRKVGSEVAYPGVGNGKGGSGEKKHYAYYQWVCFVLFLQAVMCYLPKKLLDICEGGLIAKLATGMNAFCPNPEKKIGAIIDYLARYRGEHKWYALSLWSCEGLCFANLVGQMWLMDSFLDGQFWSYGSKVLQYSSLPQNERFDAMIYIFPSMTKCTFYKFGPSGGIVSLDYLCVLPQNVANEKIYIFLWFWYIILAVGLALLLVFRLLMFLMPCVRQRLLLFRSRGLVPAETVSLITRAADFGDWWLLYCLSHNMDMFLYRDLILQLAQLVSVGHDKKPSIDAYNNIPCPYPKN